MPYYQTTTTDADGRHQYGPTYFRDRASLHRWRVMYVGAHAIAHGSIDDLTITDEAISERTEEGHRLTCLEWDTPTVGEPECADFWSNTPSPLCPCTCEAGECDGHYVSSVGPVHRGILLSLLETGQINSQGAERLSMINHPPGKS